MSTLDYFCSIIAGLLKTKIFLDKISIRMFKIKYSIAGTSKETTSRVIHKRTAVIGILVIDVLATGYWYISY